MSDLIRKSLAMALNQTLELMDEPFDPAPVLTIHPDANFWAVASIKDDAFCIDIAQGTQVHVEGLWGKAIEMGALRDHLGNPISTDVALLTTVSLAWLMLHEMEHYELGHFAVSGQLSLHETGNAASFGLVERVAPKPKLLSNLETDDLTHLHPCLEMQADHNAIELILDAYSRDQWTELRARIACIMVMMVLIEVEVSKHKRNQISHPKAATRIFQLLGHVMEMPTLEARLMARRAGLDQVHPDDLPSQSEMDAYHAQVILPAFDDALIIAKAAGSDATMKDLGERGSFIADVQACLIDRNDTGKSLRNPGAQQWVKLYAINQRIMAALEAVS